MRNYLLPLGIVVSIFILTIFCFSDQDWVDSDIDQRADDHLRKGIEFFNRGDLNLAIVELEKAIEIEPNYAINYYILGEVYTIKNKLDSASLYLEKTIGLDPEMYTAFYLYGLINKKLGHPGDAIKSLKRAVKLNPYYSEAYQLLRQVYIEVDDYESAERIDSLLYRMRR